MVFYRTCHTTQISPQKNNANSEMCQWGEEHAKIPLQCNPASACVNADDTLLAVALEHDIHIYTTAALHLHQVLKGHASRVDTLNFHPQEPRMLVSCNMNNYGGSAQAEPAIIFWDLDEQRQRSLESESTLQAVGNRIVEGVISGLQEAGSTWLLNEHERVSLAKDAAKVVELLNIKSQIRENTQIHGRVNASFGSRTFNASGTRLAFLPPARPYPQKDENICIWDTAKREVCLTLQGHSDAIMWVGFSPDDKLIGSSSWDKAFRIWSNVDGSLLHTFTTSGQNWTGAFSPDSQYFAGTSGDGHFWVWDLKDGSQVVIQEFGPPKGSWSGWSRTLDWRPDGKQLAVGGQDLGRLILFDIESQSVVQERMLSTEESPEEHRSMMGRFLEVTKVQYLAGGRQIASYTSNDHGVEIYDLVDNKKWRFAPGKAEFKGWGDDLVVIAQHGLIASVDPDAIRFWKLPIKE